MKKLGLIPFGGVSPFWLFSCRQTKPNNHEQKYPFFRTAGVWSTDKIT